MLHHNKGTSSTTTGTAISYWNDQSGNGINVGQTTAAQRHLYRTNIMNGNPAIEFDNNSTSNQNDFLTAPQAKEMNEGSIIKLNFNFTLSQNQRIFFTPSDPLLFQRNHDEGEKELL